MVEKNKSNLKKVFNPYPVLTSERLLLREVSLKDENEIFELRSNPEINKYLDRKVSKTIDDAREFINGITLGVRNNDIIYWGISFSNQDKIAGTIGLFNFTEDDTSCEIGFELLTQYQEKGIMKEAAGKVIDYAFRVIGIKKIIAECHYENKSSINLLSKLTFIQSGEGDDMVHYDLKKNK